MKTIVVDAGHGGDDYGAVFGSRYEKNDNLRMALAVGNILKSRGQRVIYTRETDVFIPLMERSYISNFYNADLFISLHRNASTNPNANGVENYVKVNPSIKDIAYATTVLNQVITVGVQSNRGVKQANYSVLKYTNAPAQLLELGFITNSVDNVLFDTNFDAYANAIATGILIALGENIVITGDRVIMDIQRTLNSRYNTGLTVDGIAGPATRRALVKGLQTELNKQYNAGLVVDGVFGPKTKAAVPNLRAGSKGNIVYLLQAALYINNFITIPDGVFGSDTERVVRNFQSAKGLSPDGIAGPNTFAKLFG